RALLEGYLFKNRKPLSNEVLEALQGNKPRVRERKPVAQRIIAKLTGFVETYINGIDA
ncbi:MAG: hypothetical protein GY757_53565, partial [bacterium]|nr:hypothetical protein [bacterium]